MDKPKALQELFPRKIFRIPDYQRGYSWQDNQLKDFWEDLVNLAQDRDHYTGVLTLKRIDQVEIPPSAKESWLVREHSYHVYHVVDGQQRLTTSVILIQSFVDFFKSLGQSRGNGRIFVSETLSVDDLETQYLFRVKPTGDAFRTYKFGYASGDPSDAYLRFNILHEPGPGQIQESFYTLNLHNAALEPPRQFRRLPCVSHAAMA
jgi:hypothetical protein